MVPLLIPASIRILDCVLQMGVPGHNLQHPSDPMAFALPPHFGGLTEDPFSRMGHPLDQSWTDTMAAASSINNITMATVEASIHSQ